MLSPTPDETQPQFAIRFHDSMASQIPVTSDRNAAMLKAWKQSRNHLPMAGRLNAQFPPDKYHRVEDVAQFHEHEVPAYTAADGRKVPATRYSRSELAEMVEGMNGRIADRNHFPAVTKGHTEIDASGHLKKDPEVLGHCGPFYLGQIGDENPQWGIFADESHDPDSVGELKKRRYRSPEVWPYKNARERFFHPVAALGAEMPRLNLPPTRYSRRLKEWGERPAQVEFYSATAAYGANTFAPKPEGVPMHNEMYGSGAAPETGEAVPAEAGPGGMDQLVEKIIEAVLSLPPVQWAMAEMQKSQAAEEEPGAMPPAAGPMPGEEEPAPGPEVYSRVQRMGNELKQVKLALANEQARRIRAERYSRLETLAQEYHLDPEQELNRTTGLNDEQFEAHCGVIAEHYKRTASNMPELNSLGGVHTPPNDAARMDAIARLAQEKGVNYGTARDMYNASQSS